MIYHWELITANQCALFEEGASWKGTMPAIGVVADVNKMGPYLGDDRILYSVSGPLFDEVKRHDTLEQAMLAVEAVVRANGDTVEGR